MKYIILMAENAMELQQAVTDFLQLNPSFQFIGGPYCDKFGHYQALATTLNQQLNG